MSIVVLGCSLHLVLSPCSDKERFGEDAASHHVRLCRGQQLGTPPLQCTDAASGHRKLKSKLKAKQKVKA